MTAEEQRQARKKALRLLEHMDRTEKGLSEKLCQAGFSPEAVQDAMEYVESFGYINDLRYAVNYISYRMESKSRQKILQELEIKGIDRETARCAWEEASELHQPDEREILRRTVEKKYPRGSQLDMREMRRLYGYLARRGFQSNDIFYVLEELEIEQIREK